MFEKRRHGPARARARLMPLRPHGRVLHTRV